MTRLIGIVVVFTLSGFGMYAYLKRGWAWALEDFEYFCWFIVGLCILLLVVPAFMGWAWVGT